MNANRADTQEYTAEAQRPRRRIAKALVVPMLAGVTLSACTGGQSTNASHDQGPPPASHKTVSPQPTTKVPSPSETISAPTGPSGAEGLAGCAPFFDTSKFTNHEYEVCTAYVANTAEVALRGLYKYGNNRVGYLADVATHHFETRYWDGPRQTIEAEVAGWPKSSSLLGNDTEASVTVLSLSSDLSADRAVLKTRESWQVTATDGSELLNESRQTKELTMCRGQLPGHPLHLWMVVSASMEPNFDCIAFDKAHNLTP